MAEISTRLLEYSEQYSQTRCVAFIEKLYGIAHAHPAALWLTLRLLTGNMDELTRSYSELGQGNRRTKQAEQQEMEAIIAALDTHYPALSLQLRRLRRITAKIE